MSTLTYYKAVRPDGTSFHDQTTRWEVGEVTRHPRGGISLRRVFRAGAENYLSVSTVPTDCTGFQWPARLLVVEPVEGHPVFRPDPEVLPNKRAATAWRVVEERPAHELFGPQGEHLVALIERAARLSADEVERLSAARDAAWDAAKRAAWDAARLADRDAAWDAAQYAAWDAAKRAARYAARYAARDAAWALLVRDIINPVHYQTLTAPWAQAVGKVHPDDPPALGVITTQRTPRSRRSSQ